MGGEKSRGSLWREETGFVFDSAEPDSYTKTWLDGPAYVT
jgi:hypothetical protein